MKKDKIIYCVSCGKKNKKEDKYCKKCNNNLKEKDNDLRNYLLDKAKSNAIDKVGEGFVGLFQLFIQNYFYGIVLSIAIVGAATSAVINANNNNNIKVAKEEIVKKSVNDEKLIIGCWLNDKEEDEYQEVMRFYKDGFLRYSMVKDDYSGGIGDYMYNFEIESGQKKLVQDLMIYEGVASGMIEKKDFTWENSNKFIIKQDQSEPQIYKRVNCKDTYMYQNEE